MKRVLGILVAAGAGLSLALALLLPASATGTGGTISLGAVTVNSVTQDAVEVNTTASTDAYNGFNLHIRANVGAGVTLSTIAGNNAGTVLSPAGDSSDIFCTSGSAVPDRVYGCAGLASQEITSAGLLAKFVFTVAAGSNGCIVANLVTVPGDPTADTYTVNAADSSAQTNTVSTATANLLFGTGTVADCPGAAPPTNTPTNTPGVPTDTPTNTPAAPTNTPTNTPAAPTNTPTNTPAAPTNTPTNTPVGVPTDTPTNTPSVPTDTPTNTPSVPTDTPTNTPVGAPTDTPTNTPTSTAPTDTPVATSTPSSECLTFNEKFRLLIGIIRHLGARQGDDGRHGRFWWFFHPRYDAKFDVNHDGVINFDDLKQVFNTPTCPLRRFG